MDAVTLGNPSVPYTASSVVIIQRNIIQLNVQGNFGIIFLSHLFCYTLIHHPGCVRRDYHRSGLLRNQD